MTDQLFTLDICEPVDDPTAGMSAQRKFTWRQHQRLNQGLHPLSILFGHIPLHANAAPADDRTAPGPRCGNCQHRERNRHGFQKCTFGDGARVSCSSNSDCRAWWPACTDYAPAGGA